MKIHIVNHARLAVVLSAAVAFAFTASARAEDSTSAPESGAAAGAAATVAVAGAASAAATERGEAGSPAQASEVDLNAAALGDPRKGAGVSAGPPSSASPDATGIAQAVRQAINQASTRQPQPPDGGGEETLAAESNATSQLAWQVQISQCTAHCVGSQQSQIALQGNSTVQLLGDATTATSADGTHATRASSSAASEVTQIQLGCLSRCFGSTSRAAGALAGFGQAVEQILRELAAGLASLSPGAALYESAVEQVSRQTQSGPGEAAAQTQMIWQVNRGVQIQPRASSAEGTPAGSAGAEVLNQTTQGIWQLQIGCLIFCRETVQYQQAQQSNRTVQAVLSSPAGASGATSSATDLTTQLIWQAQIGCLFWCYDATETQLASASNVLVRAPGDDASAPPGSESSAPPAAGKAPPAPLATADALPSPVDGASPSTPGSANAGAATPPADVLASANRRSAHGAVGWWRRASSGTDLRVRRAGADSPLAVASHDAARSAVERTSASWPGRSRRTLVGTALTQVAAGASAFAAIATAAVAAVAALAGLCAFFAAVLRGKGRLSATSPEE